jgi:hypothetical protein
MKNEHRLAGQDATLFPVVQHLDYGLSRLEMGWRPRFHGDPRGLFSAIFPQGWIEPTMEKRM